MPNYTCTTCGSDFDVPDAALKKYPGWVPKQCLNCKKGKGQASKRKAAPARRSATVEQDLTLAEVLERYKDGPQDGVFTDGASNPNPGPGGWGAVFVADGAVVAQNYGRSAQTTNNQMELTALIEGCKLVPEGQSAVIWTDSQLCVNTINKWASGWKRNGWKRKSGPIKNLELVQELYSLCQARPELELRWIAAHSGNRWNEYADALSTAYRRDTL